MLQAVRARGVCNPRAIAARRGEALALAAARSRSNGNGGGGQVQNLAAAGAASPSASPPISLAAPRVFVPGPDGQPMEITLAPRRRRRGPAQAAAAGDPRVLRLRGLPFTATEQDVAEFFEGFGVDVRGVTGSRRKGGGGGEESEEGGGGGGEEEVAPAAATESEEGKEEEEAAAAPAAPPAPERDDDDGNDKAEEEEKEETPPEEEGEEEEEAPTLPPSTRAADSLAASSLLSPPPSSSLRGFDSGVELVMRSDGAGGITGSGTAYVRFVSPEAADRARAARHRKLLGNR